MRKIENMRLVFVLLLLTELLFFFNLSAWAGRPRSEIPWAVQKTLYLSQKAIEQKDYAQARKFLLDYVQKYPEKPHAMIYYLLGNTWYLSHDLQNAYDAYKTGIALDPDCFALCQNFAQAAYELGKYREAGKFFEQAFSLADKPDGELLYNAALSWYQAKAYHKAVQSLERLFTRSADKVQKDWVELYVYVLLELKKFKKAENAILRRLAHNPTTSEFWKLLAYTALQKQDYPQAVSALEVAYKLEPPTSKEWLELANIYSYLNLPLNAAKALEKAYGSSPDPKKCDELAKEFALARRLDKAIHYLDLALQKEPTSQRYLEKGKIYYRFGKCAEAAREFQKALSIEPENGLAHFMLGVCAMELENFSMAKNAFLEASKDRRYKEQARSFLAALKD
ncbi:tetratricopeptide repeat protein [Desulfohalobiaceae bacterium Ax17]|uniref:tetratricopeptide repeat protein n=1 Tax=Desulfovulcanus ferrireducens TaxID=2831190 RepID=UPI00207BAB0E|nr:tetratricopeptide repeat protein [Desulfovulcanus ferrireducens]